MKNYLTEIKFGWLWMLMLLSYSIPIKAQESDSVFSVAGLTNISLFNSVENKNEKLLLPRDKSVLLIFLSPDCPLCKNYSSVLNGLQQQFESSVSFYGIIPGNAYTAEEIDSFRSGYHIQFPLFTDKQKQLSNYVKATATPEVILLDNKQQLLYKGAIDNWAVSFGKQRQKASKYYLQDAIAQSIQHEEITVKRTQPVGCRINDF